jgi:hypothetical protein
MVLGVDGDLYIVADGSGAFAAGSHRTGVGQRDLLVGCVLNRLLHYLHPLSAGTQQKAMPVIGFLNATSAPSPPDPFMAPFHQGLSESGYVEGQNLAIEYRAAENNYDRLPALADLVGREVDLIGTIRVETALVAKNATSTIPIVFMGVSDPVTRTDSCRSVLAAGTALRASKRPDAAGRRYYYLATDYIRLSHALSEAVLIRQIWC